VLLKLKNAKRQNKKLYVIPAKAGIPLFLDTPKFDQWDPCLRRNDGKSVYQISDPDFLIVQHVKFK
jgi:hypothetical protein